MILISRKVDYATIALCHLSKNSEGTSARELAGRYCLSRPFIANILKQLCHQGLVESQRGVHGGYKLARLPKEITLAEVISALEGPFQLTSCAGAVDETACGLEHVCPIRGPLKLVHDRLLATLAEVTLEELAGHDETLVTLRTEGKPDGCAADLLGQ